ncbi:e3 ubiquitin-protein ligase rnf14 [Stylonychia lemnae]|uniref:RBR-type E3 ubiquitin transferase n=1 Tax=Stylonychia lemnae TaxID=5949 RepID=A0A078B6C6_STYLE|nr:e3 ubiquitin-protein ligase rnf14 [Stylonychia lemnae]|eukprot:CDW89108.1 e3 ubiquitin-protein ligase rnf14 [Stylonychia lemnae]
MEGDLDNPPDEQIDLSEDQILSNIEMQNMELEALTMTLNEKEMKVTEDIENGVAFKMLELHIKPQKFGSPINMNVLHSKGFQVKQEQIEQLPKITLKIKLKRAYPSSQPAIIMIEGFYEKFMSKIEEILNSKWSEDQLILYEWFTYCQQDIIIDLLNDKKELIVDSIQYQQYKEEMIDTIKYTLDIEETNCEICYQLLVGHDNFLILNACGHYFCKSCMHQYAEDLINQGEISKLLCPHYSGCKTFLTEVNLRSINIPEDQIEKLTKFSINQAIEKMDDFGWCPVTACGAPAEVDKVKNFGQCTQCRFVFCITCREKYHFFKQCPALKIHNTNYDQLEKDAQIDNFVKNQFNQIQEQMNLHYIKQCTKQCPNCKFTIQKVDGCNKMICSRCGIFFCWMCVKQISGYSHFSESPQCGDILGAEIPDNIQNKHEVKYDIVADVLKDCIHCPECRTLITRIDACNLLKCYQCKNEFCYQCGRATPEGKDHYENTNCYYLDFDQIKMSKQLNKKHKFF